MTTASTRRTLLKAGLSAAALPLANALADEKVIQGVEESPAEPEASASWQPISDRKIRVGLIGYGLCKFAAAFGFQDHPNVEVAAVSDLIPERCNGLAQAARCETTYPSLEELVKDDAVEAVFIATDAPSHARHAILALEHGKHVACAVPACHGSLEDADALFQAVKKARGLKYMMFETSYFHEDLHAMRELYRRGDLGEIVYAEGEYYHYMPEPLDSFRGWRIGSPPQWYPTHATAYYVGVGRGSFTEVSCMGIPGSFKHHQPANNRYKNPFGTEIALLRTADGGTARMAVSWDTPGAHGEMGRVRGSKGSFYGNYEGVQKDLPPVRRPPLPPTVKPGGHGGSHGHLTNEFVAAILEDRQPLVDVGQSLAMTVAGIVAHQSALKNGELLKIPQFRL